MKKGMCILSNYYYRVVVGASKLGLVRVMTPPATITQSREDYPSAKGSADHVSHFSEAHHNWTQQGRTPRSPIFDHHPTPTDTSSAHPPSRCVPTTTPSAARRSTPARCVLQFTLVGVWEEKRAGIVRFQRRPLRYCIAISPTHPTSTKYTRRFRLLSLRARYSILCEIDPLILFVCLFIG